MANMIGVIGMGVLLTGWLFVLMLLFCEERPAFFPLLLVPLVLWGIGMLATYVF